MDARNSEHIDFTRILTPANPDPAFAIQQKEPYVIIVMSSSDKQNNSDFCKSYIELELGSIEETNGEAVFTTLGARNVIRTIGILLERIPPSNDNNTLRQQLTDYAESEKKLLINGIQAATAAFAAEKPITNYSGREISAIVESIKTISDYDNPSKELVDAFINYKRAKVLYEEKFLKDKIAKEFTSKFIDKKIIDVSAALKIYDMAYDSLFVKKQNEKEEKQKGGEKAAGGSIAAGDVSPGIINILGASFNNKIFQLTQDKIQLLSDKINAQDVSHLTGIQRSYWAEISVALLTHIEELKKVKADALALFESLNEGTALEKKQDLISAINTMNSYKESLAEDSPERGFLQAYSNEIEKIRPQIPVKDMPKMTELTHRVLFNAEHRNNLNNPQLISAIQFNKTRATVIAKDISKRNKYKILGAVALAVLGVALTSLAVFALIGSFGTATPVIVALSAIGITEAAASFAIAGFVGKKSQSTYKKLATQAIGIFDSKANDDKKKSSKPPTGKEPQTFLSEEQKKLIDDLIEAVKNMDFNEEFIKRLYHASSGSDPSKTTLRNFIDQYVVNKLSVGELFHLTEAVMTYHPADAYILRTPMTLTTDLYAAFAKKINYSPTADAQPPAMIELNKIILDHMEKRGENPAINAAAVEIYHKTIRSIPVNQQSLRDSIDSTMTKYLWYKPSDKELDAPGRPKRMENLETSKSNPVTEKQTPTITELAESQLLALERKKHCEIGELPTGMKATTENLIAEARNEFTRITAKEKNNTQIMRQFLSQLIQIGPSLNLIDKYSASGLSALGKISETLKQNPDMFSEAYTLSLTKFVTEVGVIVKQKNYTLNKDELSILSDLEPKEQRQANKHTPR